MNFLLFLRALAARFFYGIFTGNNKISQEIELFLQKKAFIFKTTAPKNKH